jgi:hypothetical protein
VDGCKPLVGGNLPARRIRFGRRENHPLGNRLDAIDFVKAHPQQGLTLVHCLAQPRPCWSHFPMSPCLIDRGGIMRPTYPTDVLMLSRIVDECSP